MKTLKFNLIDNEDNEEQIKGFQKDWSVDYRKIFNNLDLIADENYMKSLRIKSSKLKEYLVKEVMAFSERDIANKEDIQRRIDELNSYDKLYPKQFKHLQALKKSLKSNVTFGGRKNLIKRSKNEITKEEWKEKRLYSLVFYGEKARKGNRFFDFKDLSKGEVLFKMESTDVKLPLRFSTKRYQKELDMLELLANEMEIPITVKLSHKEIHISFDEAILHNSKLDTKKLNKECPFKKKEQPLQRKDWYKMKYNEHETFLKEGKLERFLSVDLNPNKIGYVIMDENEKVYGKGCFEIELPKDAKYSKKRKYNYSIIIKELFKMIKHYKVSYFVIEELDIEDKNYGNKDSNRKIKNEWMLNLLKELIVRRCNETKTILREVPAYYSSFIGNLMYDMYDPIASAYELCRRGINKYNKGFKMIPEYNLDNIITDRIDSKVDLSCFNSFVELFKSIRDMSYRRNNKTFSKYLLSQKTNINVYI